MCGCAVSVMCERLSEIAACAGIDRQPAPLHFSMGEN
jgi:hypothetical protein